MLNLFENWNFHENLRSEKKQTDFKTFKTEKKDEITFFFFTKFAVFFTHSIGICKEEISQVVMTF